MAERLGEMFDPVLFGLAADGLINQMLRALEAGRKAGTRIGKFEGILADLTMPSIPWEVQLRAGPCP